MSNVLVSVVVPVYNGSAFLTECLDSLVAQEYPDIEIIVVDDGSTDSSADIADRYPRIRTLRRAHAGLGASRNTGIDAASGGLIGFCDADDMWKPSKARVQVEFLEANPETDIVLCRQDTTFEPGASHPDWLIPDQVYGDLDGVSATSALFRRGVFEQIRYRTDLEGGSDFNLLVRARAAGFGIALIEDSLRIRRIHDDNMMTRLGSAKAQLFETVREHLRAQR